MASNSKNHYLSAILWWELHLKKLRDLDIAGNNVVLAVHFTLRSKTELDCKLQLALNSLETKKDQSPMAAKREETTSGIKSPLFIA